MKKHYFLTSSLIDCYKYISFFAQQLEFPAKEQGGSCSLAPAGIPIKPKEEKMKSFLIIFMALFAGEQGWPKNPEMIRDSLYRFCHILTSAGESATCIHRKVGKLQIQFQHGRIKTIHLTGPLPHTFHLQINQYGLQNGSIKSATLGHLFQLDWEKKWIIFRSVARPYTLTQTYSFKLNKTELRWNKRATFRLIKMQTTHLNSGLDALTVRYYYYPEYELRKKIYYYQGKKYLRHVYYISGNLFTIKRWEKKKRHGQWIHFFDKKTKLIKFRRAFRFGKPYGLIYTNHPNGNTKKRAIYVNGKLHGIFFAFHRNGKPALLGHCCKGKKCRQWIRLRKDSSVRKRKTYHKRENCRFRHR